MSDYQCAEGKCKKFYHLIYQKDSNIKDFKYLTNNEVACEIHSSHE